MKWADRAKKILESPKTRTDITDISTSVGYVGAPFKAFPEKNADGETSVGSVGSTFETSQEKNENAGAERPLPDHAVDDWRCPLGHREFWVSAYGLKICSRCHPNPLELRAAWLAGRGVTHEQGR